MIDLLLIEELRSALGDGAVLVAEDVPMRNRVDSSHWPAECPLALLLPSTTKDVSDVLAICHRHSQPVVVQGGLTGVVGGGRPMMGEVAISLERMKGIQEVDPMSRTLVAWAGTTLDAIHEAAAAADLHYGVDLGSRGSCTIGGTVATNAGGVQVLRYGMTRKNLLGLEAVLADGTIVSSLSKVVKNNTGYDWPQLIVGSEGTLGIVTRVSLALVPRPAGIQSALCAFAGLSQALEAFSRLDILLPASLTAFEAMWREYMEAAERWGGLKQPFPAAAELCVLIEAALGDDAAASDRFTVALSNLMEGGLMEDAVVAQSSQERGRFWAYRESNYEFHRFMPEEVNFDISIPAKDLESAVSTIRTIASKHLADGYCLLYGHLGDSNLHVVAYPGPTSADAAVLSTSIYELVSRLGGSVSAEHGIGIEKGKYLSYSRSREEISLMRSIKRALDPQSILNPDRIFF